MASRSNKPITVALVNDYDVVVIGVANMFDQYRDRVIVAELDSNAAVDDAVDIVLYDNFAQPESDHEELAVLVANPRARRVVVYTWNFRPDLIRSAQQQGAHGYLSKTLPARELVAALEAVHAGETVISRLSMRQQDPRRRDEMVGDRCLPVRDARHRVRQAAVREQGPFTSAAVLSGVPADVRGFEHNGRPHCAASRADPGRSGHAAAGVDRSGVAPGWTPARRRRRRGIVAGLRAHHLRQPQLVETAMGHQALGYARALATVAENVASLEAALTAPIRDDVEERIRRLLSELNITAKA